MPKNGFYHLRRGENRLPFSESIAAVRTMQERWIRLLLRIKDDIFGAKNVFLLYRFSVMLTNFRIQNETDILTVLFDCFSLVFTAPLTT